MIDYKIYALGDSALTIELGYTINENINHRVLAIAYYMRDLEIVGVLDIMSAYASVSVIYDICEIRKNYTSATRYLTEQIKLAILNCDFTVTSQIKVVEIPICYDVSLGIDLIEMSLEKKMSITDIIAAHTSKLYRVYLIGFLPGFPYMGIVDESIATPRKKSPRTKIEAGNVGIADAQTGIYPSDSPGGWNIIGKTPLKMFDAKKEYPVFLQPGDDVQFKQISLEQFRELKEESEKTNEKLELSQPSPSTSILSVIKSGTADSIQDLGRFGFQHLGINPTGVMDRIAAQTANFLVGNVADEAVLECHFPACSIVFHKSILIAISGGDFTPTLDEKEIKLNTPIYVQRGATLNFKKWKNGARTYIAVKNGFEIEKWLGSYSTNLKANAGGFNGRNLKKDDQIKVKSDSHDVGLKMKSEKQDDSFFNFHFSIFPWHVEIDNLYAFEEIEILVGNDFETLTDGSQQKLFSNEFLITMRSDKMGYRLLSDPLIMKNENRFLLSSGVTLGTMQLLPTGQIIILMSDHQTTGGYPKIGHVASASFAALAQTPINKKIRFKLINIEEAEEKLMQQQKYLNKIQIACKFRLESFFNDTHNEKN